MSYKRVCKECEDLFSSQTPYRYMCGKCKEKKRIEKVKRNLFKH